MVKIAELKRTWWLAQIRYLTDDLGLSKTEISNKLGIQIQALNTLERGDRGLSDKLLDKFIEVFKINQFDLFNATDNGARTVTGHHNVVSVNGNTNIGDSMADKERISYLERILAEKERTIQILLNTKE